MKKLKVADCRKNIIRRYFYGQSLKEIAKNYKNPTIGVFNDKNEPETKPIKGFGYSAITEDRRKNKEIWEAEIAGLHAAKIKEVHEHHQLLLRATQQTDKLFERTGSEKDKRLHQQNLRELVYVSRRLAEVLEDFPPHRQTSEG